jgi:hypothetical protein
MQYIQVQYSDGTAGYQEVFQGQVQRYTDLNGTTIAIALPTGETCVVTNANPTQPSWALPDPVVPPAPVVLVPLTQLQFMALFTEAELEAIWTAAKTAVAIEIWITKFQLAGTVDLSDPQTIEAVQALETSGIIASGRAAVILNA